MPLPYRYMSMGAATARLASKIERGGRARARARPLGAAATPRFQVASATATPRFQVATVVQPTGPTAALPPAGGARPTGELPSERARVIVGRIVDAINAGNQLILPTLIAQAQAMLNNPNTTDTDRAYLNRWVPRAEEDAGITYEENAWSEDDIEGGAGPEGDIEEGDDLEPGGLTEMLWPTYEPIYARPAFWIGVVIVAGGVVFALKG